MQETIILVDENDNPIGSGEKIQVHQAGLLHRAFSIFIFNTKGEMLLQQRAKSKYHSGGLWTNACCGHPRRDEQTLAAAHRRLGEEFGFDCDLTEFSTCLYQTPFDNGLKENEFDHLFFGRFNGKPTANPEEIESYKWITITDLLKELAVFPEKYTYWFKLIMADRPKLKMLIDQTI